MRLEKKIPTLYEVKNYRKRLNQLYPIELNSFGAYVNLEVKLRMILTNTLNRLGNIKNDTFILKISCDGTNIGRNLVICNLTFTVINDIDFCKTSAGNYILGVYECNENYNNLSLCLIEAIEQLKNTHDIVIDNKLYKIDITQTHDLKGTSITHGTTDATSKYPCPFCTISFNLASEKSITESKVAQFRQTLNTDWSYCNKELGARSHEEFEECAKKDTVEQRKGYDKKPIFSFLPFQKSLPDMLHMNLIRIAERLLENFIRELDIHDHIYQIRQKDRSKTKKTIFIYITNNYFKIIKMFFRNSFVKDN